MFMALDRLSCSSQAPILPKVLDIICGNNLTQMLSYNKDVTGCIVTIANTASNQLQNDDNKQKTNNIWQKTAADYTMSTKNKWSK